MAENAFFYLAKEFPEEDIEFLVVTPKAEETIARLSQALSGRCERVSITAIQKLFTAGRFSAFLSALTGLGIKGRLAPETLDARGAIVLGGDDYTADYGYLRPIANLLRLRGYAKAGKKVVMCGQTIGPFIPWLKPVLKMLFMNITEIMAREPLTYEYLCSDMGLRNVSLTADLAFLPLPREDDPLGVDVSGLGARYFTIVPSELLWKYAQEADREAYLATLAGIAARMLGELPDYRLLVLPHVVTADSNSDRLAGRDLIIRLYRQGIDKSRMIFIKDDLLPHQARKLLGGSKFVLTGRMHAAISAYARGIPTVSLAYSRKYWGVIGEGLGMGRFVVDVRDKSWAEVSDITWRAIDELLRHYDEIRNNIIEKVQEMRNKALEGVRRLALVLKNC